MLHATSRAFGVGLVCVVTIEIVLNLLSVFSVLFVVKKSALLGLKYVPGPARHWLSA